jgi:hypothetical protein
MLRAAVVMALALLAAHASGEPRLLVPLAVGALYASANDTDRHPAGRTRHILLPAGAGALGLTAGLVLHEVSPVVALPAIAAVAAAAGAASATGVTGSAVALQLLAMLAMAQGMPLPRAWWLPGTAVLLAALGVVLLGPGAPGQVAPTWAATCARLRSRWALARAARLAAAAAAATALTLVWRPTRGYWLLLTVALVLAPDAGSVVRRATHRALGTLVGVAVAWCLLALAPGRTELTPVVVLAEALVPLAAAVSYGMLTTVVAPIVFVLLDLSGVPMTGHLAAARVLDTLAGVTVALGVSTLLRPARPAPVPGAPVPT